MSKTILFQGDSITDCGRDRENDMNVGTGYPLLVKAELGFEKPEQYDFINRGISGNRIVDVYARIKQDIINLKPDYMSILIGINDVWHEIARQNGVAPAKFEKIYDMLLEEIKEALPGIKLMILAPFVLKGSATCVAEEPDRWSRFDEGTKANAVIARKLAEKHGATFVELQSIFDELDAAHPGLWTGDGVHPTAAGHEVIKREWLKAFRTL
ncbi:MAG: lysophospholipase [Ruminococcaceae bacterium]|nr:lysophospholipase [Oscillospiraceae bacterium]